MPNLHLDYRMRGIAFAILLFGLLGGSVAPAQAFCRMSTNQGQECCDPLTMECTFLAWRRRCMTISLEATDSQDLARNTVETILVDSFTAWTEISCGAGPAFEVQLDGEASRCSIPEFNSEGGNVNSIAFIRDWTARENDPAAFALSTVWHNPTTGEIFDVDMEVNEDRGPFGICPTVRGCRDGTVDLQNVMTHEAGHFFGIGHSLDRDSTMFASSVPGETSRRTLTDDDRNAICAAYPDGSLPTNCNFAPLGGLVRECGGGDGCSCSVVTGPKKIIGAGLLVSFVALLLAFRARKKRPSRLTRQGRRLDQRGRAPHP